MNEKFIRYFVLIILCNGIKFWVIILMVNFLQVMMKVYRLDLDDLRNFVLVEELEVFGADFQFGRRYSSESVERRIFSDDENVYLVQSEWKINGKFVIMDRYQAETEENFVCGLNMKIFKLVVLIMLMYFVLYCIDLCIKCGI